MRLAPLILLAGILISGCHSEPTPPVDQTKKEPAASALPTDSEIKPGMSMAEVKKIKGEPRKTAYDHGPNNSELNFWMYDDATIKFQDGIVIE